MAFLRGESPLVLWREFRRNISDEAMRHIAENEFEEVISEITQETIQTNVEALQKETTQQVQQIKNKL
jgi:hypothetical protein